MINIVINNSCFQTPNSWHELKLGTAIKLRNAISESKNLDYLSIVNIIGTPTENIKSVKTQWQSILDKFIEGLTKKCDYQILHIRSFNLNQKNYKFCELNSLTAQQICTLNHLYLTDALENASTICSILCMEQNAEIFAELTMDIVYEVFYHVCTLNQELKSLYPISYKDNQPTWNEKLIFTANAIPSEVEKIKNTNIHDFFQILEYKLKNKLT